MMLFLSGIKISGRASAERESNNNSNIIMHGVHSHTHVPMFHPAHFTLLTDFSLLWVPIPGKMKRKKR